jgi:hypothetical protein
MHAWTRWLCLAWFAFAAAPTLAQPITHDPDRRPYVTFDIDKDAAGIIEKRLKLEKDLAPFKEFVNLVLADPKGVHADFLKKLGGAQFKDEKLKQAFQNLLNNDPALKNGLRDWIKNNQANIRSGEAAKSLKELEGALQETKPRPTNTDPGTQTPDMKSKADAKPNETISKAIQDEMKQVENSPLGDWLKNSPAWQQAFRDLRNSMENPQASKWKLSKLLTPDGKAWKLGEAAVERIKNMPRPDLERWNPKLSLPGLGSIPTPNLGPPALPTFSRPPLSAGAAWLLLAALCLLAGWQMMRWSQRSAVGFDSRVRLGPWPVRPDDVATRTDLVQAFDYLAILTLGFDAKSWNHQAIARRWCANSPANAPTANALARLYEQARYTDGPSELTQPQRDQARQALLQLAEAR